MPKPLEGGIAKIVASALVKASMTKAAVLTKVTPGTRLPGAVTGGTNPTTQDFTARGIVQDHTALLAAGTLIAGVTRVIRMIGATIATGAVPEPGDRITIEGSTSVIVDEGVERDPASATYLCQCKS
jgi:hypothetical protein